MKPTPSIVMALARAMIERVRRNLYRGPLSDEDMVEAEADELMRLAKEWDEQKRGTEK